jgi:hypothetical protein
VEEYEESERARRSPAMPPHANAQHATITLPDGTTVEASTDREGYRSYMIGGIYVYHAEPSGVKRLGAEALDRHVAAELAKGHGGEP